MPTNVSFAAHCVIGPGRLGGCLAAALQLRGEQLAAVGVRSQSAPDTRPPLLPVAAALRLAADVAARQSALLVVWLTVPDDAIAAVAAETAAALGTDVPKMAVVHCSGLGGLDLLEAWRRRGAVTLSLHPLQSLTANAGAQALAGVPMAVTSAGTPGRELGGRLAEILGCVPFDLPDESKRLYHLAATVASNLLVALEAEGAELLRQAAHLADTDGALRMLGPLVSTTLSNALSAGPRRALTGPVARGDVGTVRAHLEALERQPARLRRVYRALSLQALSLAAPALDNDTVEALQDLLGAYPDQSGALERPGVER